MGLFYHVRCQIIHAQSLTKNAKESYFVRQRGRNRKVRKDKEQREGRK